MMRPLKVKAEQQKDLTNPRMYPIGGSWQKEISTSQNQETTQEESTVHNCQQEIEQNDHHAK